MLYELCSYDVHPDRWDDFVAWTDTRAIPVLSGQFGYRLVGRWQTVPQAGEAVPATNYHYLLAWDDEDDWRARRALAAASEAWHDAWAETIDPDTGESKYFLRINHTLLRPFPDSPLQ